MSIQLSPLFAYISANHTLHELVQSSGDYAGLGLWTFSLDVVLLPLFAYISAIHTSTNYLTPVER